MVIGSLLYAAKEGAFNARLLELKPRDWTATLYMDSTEGGSSVGRWLNDEQNHFSCTFQKLDSQYNYCGYDISFSGGIDLRSFGALIITFDYFGEGEVFRVYLRNLNPRLQLLSHDTKYMRRILKSATGRQERRIPLHDFEVAQWWLEDHSITGKDARPNFDNIVHFGIDVPSPAPAGEHTFHIHSIFLEKQQTWQSPLYLTLFSLDAILLLASAAITFTRSPHKRTADVTQDHPIGSDNPSPITPQVPSKERYLDKLTGVLNQEGLDNRHTNNLCAINTLLVINIEGIADINRNYSHDTGDQTLIQASKKLLHSLSSDSSLCRWSDTTFAALCPNTSVEQAYLLAENIRKSLSSMTFTNKTKQALKVEINLSIATTQRNEKLQTAFKRAEQALIHARSEGKNNTIFAG